MANSSPPPLADHILLGVVGQAHGIRGEVLVRTFTDDPANLASYGSLTDGRRLFDITSMRATPKGLLVTFAGVADRTGAEALRNVRLHVHRDCLPPPDDGDFYIEDLKGLDAVDQAGQRIGRVVDVVNYGAGDLIEVAFSGEPGTEYIPFRDATVPDVDLAARRLTLIRPDLVEARDVVDE